MEIEAERAGAGAAGHGAAGAAAALERDEHRLDRDGAIASIDGTSLGELARGLCGDLSGDCQTPWPPLLLSARLLRLQP